MQPRAPIRRRLALIALLGLAAAATRAQAPERSPEEWNRQFEEEEAKIVLPVDPRHRRLALTPAWLAGYWVSGKAACYGSDSGIRFDADGGYQEHEASGRYAIRGRRVRLVETQVHDSPAQKPGPGDSFEVRLIGPNEIETRWRDGRSGLLYRCPPEPLEP